MPEAIENDQQAGTALYEAMQEDGQRPAGMEGPGAAEPTLHAEQALENQRAASNPEGEPVVPAATETPSETAASFTKLDPNTLPDELKPWYHSMQADYTRKTQTIADLRKQYESLGDADPNQVNFAMDFYNNLQNPDFAKSFHEQLGGTLANLGYLDQQVEELTQPQPATPAVTPDSYDDPDQFFQQKFGEYEAKLNTLQSTIQAQQEAAEQQTAYAAFAGEIQRQDSIIRDANPHYADADFDAIYKMSEAYGGDLFQAQGAYENAVADRINRMLAAKTSVSQQFRGEVVGSGTSQEPKNFGDNLEAAHRAAQEALRQHLANE